MENVKASSKKIILNYGALLGIASVILGVVMYVTNSYTDPHWIYSVIGFLILISSIVLGVKAFKVSNNGYLILTEALKIGIGIALIGGIISSLWSFTLATVIEPDYAEQMMEVQREKMIEQYPDFPQEQIDQSMAIVEKFSNPFVSITMTLIGSLFLGFVISLIVGLVMQKKQDLH